MSTTNGTWTDPGVNLGLCRERLATKRLNRRMSLSIKVNAVETDSGTVGYIPFHMETFMLIHSFEKLTVYVVKYMPFTVSVIRRKH
jgi:hypothetical protein